MATYYWTGSVNGGTGTWDATTTTNWSASTGGAGGAGVPNATDTAIFDANSGAGTVTIGVGAVCFVFSSSAYTGTIDFGTSKITVSGNAATVLTLGNNVKTLGSKTVEFNYTGGTGERIINGGSVSESNAVSVKIISGSDSVRLATSVFLDIDFTGFAGTYNNSTATKTVFGNLTIGAETIFSAGAGGHVFASTSATPKLITSNGKIIDAGGCTFNGVGGTWRFADAFNGGSTRTLTLTNGTLDGNGQNITIGLFSLGAGTKTLTLGNGTWTVAGATWNANTNAIGLTVSASTGVVSMTSASSKTFAGGGFIWPTLGQGGTGALRIQQANTFANITNTVQPATITFPASTVTTVSAFSVSGTSGNLITLNSSTPGTRATLSDVSGVNSVSFCNIQDSNATGGAIWNSLTSAGNINGGNNLNWNFSVTPQTVTEVTYALRSFTQPRRF